MKELKNKLTYYLKLTRKGDKIIVTDRGAPLAIIRNLENLENAQGLEERLTSLANIERSFVFRGDRETWLNSGV